MRTYKNENDVKRHVKELLDTHGWTHWANAAGPYSIGGIEDRSALKRGFYLGIECKFSGRKQTALQTKRGEAVRKAGGKYVVIDEDTIPLLEGWLEAFDNDNALAK